MVNEENMTLETSLLRLYNGPENADLHYLKKNMW